MLNGVKVMETKKARNNQIVFEYAGSSCYPNVTIPCGQFTLSQCFELYEKCKKKCEILNKNIITYSFDGYWEEETTNQYDLELSTFDINMISSIYESDLPWSRKCLEIFKYLGTHDGVNYYD